jgi:hypothetical protein
MGGAGAGSSPLYIAETGVGGSAGVGGVGAQGAGMGATGGAGTTTNSWQDYTQNMPSQNNQQQRQRQPELYKATYQNKDMETQAELDRLYKSRPDLMAKGGDFYMRASQTAKEHSKSYPPKMAAQMALMQS